jgi:hypothetical protein
LKRIYAANYAQSSTPDFIQRVEQARKNAFPQFQKGIAKEFIPEF